MSPRIARIITESVRSISQYRIVIYFILGIVLPGILMGLLALRGIHNDQALSDRESRRLALRQGSELIEEVDTRILNLEQEFLGEIFDDTASLESGFYRLMDVVAENEEVINAYLVSDSGVSMQCAGLQYMPAVGCRSSSSPTTTIAGEPEEAWAIEYRNGDLDSAIDFYQRIRGLSSDPSQRAMAFNAIARIQKKLGNSEGAASAYEAIYDSFPDYHLANTIPLGLIAAVELCHVYLSSDETDAGMGWLHQALIDLNSTRWNLEEASYRLFVDKAKAAYRELPESTRLTEQGRKLAILISQLREAEASTRRQLHILAMLQDQHKSSSLVVSANIPYRVPIVAEQQKFILSCVPGHEESVWCMLISSAVFADRQVMPILQTASATGRWRWLIDDGTQGSGAISVNFDPESFVETRFPPYMQDLTLVGIARPASLFTSVVESGNRVYLYMFMFIGGTMIIGLLFVTYSINREVHLTRMKSQFIDTVSHEFKSPLTAIRQITEMLQSKRVPVEKREKYYAVMLQQASRLNQLINNILDFSRIERGKKTYRFERVNLAPVLKSCVERWQERLEGTDFNIDLELTEPLPEVLIDVSAVEQVIDNLIDNSVKYSGDARTLIVRSSHKEASIVTSVTDFGIGIPRRHQSRVFDRFHRAENSGYLQSRGSGIGLNLVLENVAAHGGETWLTSQQGKGTTVYFSLPVDSSFND